MILKKYTLVFMFFISFATLSHSSSIAPNKENINPKHSSDVEMKVPEEVLPSSGKKRKALVEIENVHENQPNISSKRVKSSHNYSGAIVEILEEFGINPDLLWLSSRYVSHREERLNIKKSIKDIPKHLGVVFENIITSFKFILNQNYINNNIIYKDILRRIHELTGQKGNFNDLVIKLERRNLRVLEFTPDFYEVETKVETEEEREARKKHEKILLKKVLEDNQVDHSRVSSLEKFEEESWKGFIRYFSDRKQKIDKREIKRKISRGEIERVFDRLVAPHYEKFESSGTFFYAPKTILWDLKKDGLTNLQRLKIGLAPIGVDGVAMNVHHVTHHQPGYYILITQTFHQKNNQSLYFKSARHYPVEKNIDRSGFEKIKKSIFLKIASIIEETLTNP